MRITVRVQPGASRTAVGGQYGDAGAGQPAVLVVRVRQRALDGAATAAVLEAVATAFGTRRSAVRLVAGGRSRTKVLELEPAPPDAAERFEALLHPL
ncbi:MAG TPA: DUF167 domain-containing protein [Pedococcus sp.]|nr:DUF167 domain-containing protein [Pedococcus sp.]